MAEAAPSYKGHEMARQLASGADPHITTTVIHDSAVFAIMARVNKVRACSVRLAPRWGMIEVGEGGGGHTAGLHAGGCECIAS